MENGQQAAQQPSGLSPEFAEKLSALSSEARNRFSSEINQIQQQAQPAQPPVESQPASQPPLQVPNAAEQLFGTSEPAPTNPNVTAAAADAGISIDAFGGKFNLGQQEPKAPELQGMDEVNKYIASQLEGVDGLQVLLDRYKNTVEENSKLSEVRSQFDTYTKSLQSLDPQLLKAINTYEQGGDWRSELMSAPQIDFSKNATDFDKEALVKTYFGDKVSADDFSQWGEDKSDYDPSTSRMMDAFYDQAIQKFNADKAQNTLTFEQATQQRQQQQQKYAESVKSSLNSIQSLIPSASSEYIQTIEQDFLQNKINSVFSTSEGELLPDAALRYALAKDGIDLVKQLMKVATERANTEANLQIIERSNKSPQGNLNSGVISSDTPGVRKEFLEQVKALTSGLNDNNSMFRL